MTETEIQKEILTWLSQRGFFVWRNQNMPTRHRQNLTFVLKGMPDIMILCRAQFIGIEVKTNEGRLSPEQLERGDDINKHGGHYFVVRSLAEAIEVLSSNGILPDRI